MDNYTHQHFIKFHRCLKEDTFIILQKNSTDVIEPKILAIIGSPKGKTGNGYRSVQKIEAQINKLGPAQFTYIFLKDINLNICRGCFTCVSRGENFCPLKDDREKIENLIETHDALILSSPGYVQNVSALMKNFMDRFSYTHHRPRYFDKKVMIVANGGAGLDKTLAALSIAIGGPQIVSKLSIIAPPWPIKDKVREKNEHKIKDASEKLYLALQKKKLPVPTFGNLLIFKFFKKISKECQTWLPADYVYYKNLEGYYYETNLNPLKAGSAKLLVKIMGFLMRDMGPKIHYNDS